MVLVILDTLHFHMNFRILLSISTKMLVGVLIEIALNLQINQGEGVGSYCHLKVLSFLIHKHVILFIYLSLIAFNNVY